MPYIKQSDRNKFITKGCLAKQIASSIETEGELNYFITKLCHAYIKKHGKSYKTLNGVHGALTCAQLELYRRITAPYEEIKIKENGDVNETD